MVIVAGHITVRADRRSDYLAGCAPIVEAARRAPGCVDFAIAADLLRPERINIFECWETTRALEAFRGAGPEQEQAAAILTADVVEYRVGQARPLG